MGQTRRGLVRRLYEHRWDSGPTRKRPKDRNLPVHYWIRKHGPENIVGAVIEEVEPELLNDREIYWIAQYREAGYDLLNLHAGGDQPVCWSHSEESRRKISEAGRNRIGGNRAIQDLSIVPLIRTRIATGESYASISNDLDLGYSVVSEIARGVNYAKVNDEGVFDPNLPVIRESLANGHASHRKINDIDKVKTMLDDGLTYEEIATCFGVKTAAIANFVSRNNLHPRRPRLTPERKARIIQSFQDDPTRSLRAIAREFETSHAVIGRVLREAGVRS